MRRLLVTVVFLLVAPLALAQGGSGTVELTPTVGYWFGDSLGRGTDGSMQYDVMVDDAPAYGLRLAYNLSDSWAMEFLLSRERADLIAGKDQLFGGKVKLGTIDLTAGEIGFAVGFGHRRLVPFLAAGVGGMHLDPRMAGTSSDTRFSANIGAGFKLFFSPDIALRFDWRVHGVDSGHSDHNCDWWEDCHDRREWIRFTEVALGLSFAF